MHDKYKYFFIKLYVLDAFLLCFCILFNQPLSFYLNCMVDIRVLLSVFLSRCFDSLRIAKNLRPFR